MSWLILFHVFCGAVALGTFWIPLVAVKGGTAHIRSGWIYSVAMFLVAITSFIITPWRFFFDVDATTNSRFSAVFLFFISLFALTALQQGLFVLKTKTRKEKLLTVKTVGLPVFLMVVSALILTTGIIYQRALFIAFGIIAGRTAWNFLKYWKNTPGVKGWFFFHIESMFTCCIATVTAFAVTAVPRFYPQLNSLGIWLAPTVVMVPWMLWFIKAYQRKFGITAAVRS